MAADLHSNFLGSKSMPPRSFFFCFEPKIIPSCFGFWTVLYDDAVNFYTSIIFPQFNSIPIVNVKVIPQQAEVAQGVPGRLRLRIFLTFGTTRVVGRQPNAPAAFTPREIPGTHFQRLSRPQGLWFHRGYHGKNPQWHHQGIDPGTVRLVAQRLNHYATPGTRIPLVVYANMTAAHTSVL